MMARTIRTSHAKNSTIPGMAYPLMVLVLATTASYPPMPNLIDGLTDACCAGGPAAETHPRAFLDWAGQNSQLFLSWHLLAMTRRESGSCGLARLPAGSAGLPRRPVLRPGPRRWRSGRMMERAGDTDAARPANQVAAGSGHVETQVTARQHLTALGEPHTSSDAAGGEELSTLEPEPQGRTGSPPRQAGPTLYVSRTARTAPATRGRQ